MSTTVLQLAFFVIILAIAGFCLVVAVLLSRRGLRPLARNLLIAVIVAEVILAVLHLLQAAGVFSDGATAWFFDLRHERNLGTSFSSLQLMMVGFVALSVALFAPGFRLWQRAYWLLASVLFAYLSFDEFYSLHNYFGGRGPSDAYQLPYAIGAIVFFSLSGLAYWFGFRRHLLVFFLLLAGLTIMVTGGVLIEELVEGGFVDHNPQLEWMSLFEEMGEMIGATVSLAGLLLFAQQQLHGRGWAALKTVALGGGVLWSAWMVFALYFQPLVELRLTGVPVNVNFGKVSLIGYDVTPEVIEPGGEAMVTLYWRANEPLDTDYSLSIHALSHPEIESVAQSDDLHVGIIPSHAWIPGVVMKRTHYIQFPRNLPAPASYWLTVRIWSGPWPLGRPWQDTTGLPVSFSENRPLLADDAVILASIPALGATPPPDPAVAAAYHFAGQGITLDGYALPEETVEIRELPVSFWWRISTAPDRDLTQFFHLVPQGDGELLAFDQQPFGGRFPTKDWPAGLNVVDEWTLALPEDMDAGTYDVYTGLYDVTTMERMAVTDSSGAGVEHNAIHLGSIEFAPSAEAEAAVAEARAREAANVCYALSDANSRTGSEADTLVVVSLTTGKTVEIGQTGSVKIEGMTFNADRTALYAADEREVAQFGVIDLASGVFTPVGDGLVSADEPARNPALYDAFLKDIDSMALEPETGIVWGVHQDEENLLFQVDTETGTIVRDAFGEGYDYLKIDLSGLSDLPYNNVKDMAVDPVTGTFYILAGTEAFDSALATLDFDAADLTTGLIPARLVSIPTSTQDGAPILDVEGMSFTPDGTLYVISTNNSNSEANYDMLWRLDPGSGEATPITRLSDDVDAVDYEAIACNSAG